jgi:Zn-dependent protease with chaperone function
MADTQQNQPKLPKNDATNQENDETPSNSIGIFKNFPLFASIWSLIGIIAFLLSLVCFGYSGTFGQKILGLVISLVFGPFYFLYYYFSGSYCKSNSVGGRRRRK